MFSGILGALKPEGGFRVPVPNEEPKLTCPSSVTLFHREEGIGSLEEENEKEKRIQAYRSVAWGSKIIL